MIDSLETIPIESQRIEVLTGSHYVMLIVHFMFHRKIAVP
jgi:hypothetical protein